MPLVTEGQSKRASRKPLFISLALGFPFVFALGVFLLPTVHPVGVWPDEVRLGRVAVAGTWGPPQFFLDGPYWTDAETCALFARPGFFHQQFDGVHGAGVAWGLRVGKLSWAVLKR